MDFRAELPSTQSRPKAFCTFSIWQALYAVTIQVSQLEHRLGVRLRPRTMRRVFLAKVGTIFHRRDKALLDELASASLTQLRSQARCGLPFNCSAAWMSPALS